MSSSACDILVVGGGPAGCAFARTLARLRPSLRIVMIDSARFPRDKTCGDALTHGAIKVALDLFPELQTLLHGSGFTQRQTFHYPGGLAVRRSLPVSVVPRALFDAELWRLTRAPNIEQRPGVTLDEVCFEGGRVVGARLSGGGVAETISCAWLVGADGSRSEVRRQTGATDRDVVVHALRQYLRGIPSTTEGLHFFIDTEDRGYFWLFPFDRDGERWANVGYGTWKSGNALRPKLSSFLSDERVKRLSGAAVLTGKPIGFPLNLAPVERGRVRMRRPLGGPGFLLLGDAAALIQPASGEGISFALQSGSIAAEALADESITDKARQYEKRLLRTIGPQLTALPTLCAFVVPQRLPKPILTPLLSVAAWAQRHRLFT